MTTTSSISLACAATIRLTPSGNLRSDDDRYVGAPRGRESLSSKKPLDPRDAVILSFLPHMHLRGKDYEYQAIYPDGRKEVLLSVPQYDFNWQHTYRLTRPLHVPKGTTLRCVAHFDNSPGNPANPNPKSAVFYGEQTWEEMMIGYIDFYWAEEAQVKEK